MSAVMSAVNGANQHRNLTREVAGFVIETDAFYQTTQNTPPHLRFPGYDAQAAIVVEASRVEINACVYALGGLAIVFDDTNSGRRVSCAVDQWLGYDPEKPEQLLWSIKGAPEGEKLTVDLDAIAELRDELG